MIGATPNEPREVTLQQKLAENRERLKKLAEHRSRLAQEVEDLTTENEYALDLLHEIICTFRLQKNRDELSAFETGRKLLEIADRWDRRFKRGITGETVE